MLTTSLLMTTLDVYCLTDMYTHIHTHTHIHIYCMTSMVRLDTEEWAGLPALYDLKIFVDSDVEKCIERIKIRNRCIPG